MLYRTHHHPFLFTFNPFSHSSSALSSHLLPSPRLQGMEAAQGDFRGGLVPETAAKTAVLVDECLGVNGDDFFVDELLDFSNGYSETEEQPPAEESQEIEQGKDKNCCVSQEKETAPPEDSSLSGKDDFGSLHESELSFQAEGLESLEWLSHFVEDSFSDYPLAGKLPPKPTENSSGTEATAREQPCFTTPVQTKARTKRARSGVRVWPVLSPSFTETSTSSSSSTSSTTSFPQSNLWLVQTQTGESSLGKTPAKKQKRKPAEGGGGGAAQPRRCSHCGVTKTPQWRAGPLGSKTLCNACGVRFKSGRLLPEYRPACSPTFSSELHSNNHRKVLEMRRKKEEAETTGLAPPVQSF
ncbi:UNVERIFIED_CONTAM: GATA transcription factor 5 [Sesamum angustifolium]|uniref:GATA transcription factor 5 n=1 Tax=Sesamum angustifolium TaxID=2727405 RepID=A0AAW2NKS3_9LAMI